MDRNRVLELALEGLEKEKAEIEQEIAMIQAEMRGVGSIVQQAADVPATVAGRRRSRTPAEREAQGERMRQYWATRKGKTEKVTDAAGPKRRAKTAAEKKAISLKMKEAWKKRKAAAKKG
jgi:hypothetical protein